MHPDNQPTTSSASRTLQAHRYLLTPPPSPTAFLLPKGTVMMTSNTTSFTCFESDKNGMVCALSCLASFTQCYVLEVLNFIRCYCLNLFWNNHVILSFFTLHEIIYFLVLNQFSFPEIIPSWSFCIIFPYVTGLDVLLFYL